MFASLAAWANFVKWLIGVCFFASVRLCDACGLYLWPSLNFNPRKRLPWDAGGGTIWSASIALLDRIGLHLPLLL